MSDNVLEIILKCIPKRKDETNWNIPVTVNKLCEEEAFSFSFSSNSCNFLGGMKRGGKYFYWLCDFVSSYNDALLFCDISCSLIRWRFTCNQFIFYVLTLILGRSFFSVRTNRTNVKRICLREIYIYILRFYLDILCARRYSCRF